MHKFNSLRSQIIVSGEEQPLVCPVCNYILRDDADVMSVKNDSACTECIINFKHVDIDQWELGCRPSIEEARAKMHI